VAKALDRLDLSVADGETIAATPNVAGTRIFEPSSRLRR
jgi:hypothetical protein